MTDYYELNMFNETNSTGYTLATWYLNLDNACRNDDPNIESNIMDQLLLDYKIELHKNGIFRFYDRELFVKFVLTYG